MKFSSPVVESVCLSLGRVDTASIFTPTAPSCCFSDVIYIATFEDLKAASLKIQINQTKPPVLKDEGSASFRNVSKYLPVGTS
jgi:hypothetical protein